MHYQKKDELVRRFRESDLGVGVAILNRLIRGGSNKEVLFEQKPD